MKELIIIGASAMGREAYHYAKECGMEVKGFLDARKDILDRYSGYPRILAAPDDYVINDNDVFVCAIGDGAQRRRYVKVIEGKGGKFVSIVHPSAYVGINVKIGQGSIICPNVSVTEDVILGNHVIINVNSSVSHDCRLEDFVTISPGCHVAGWCKITTEAFLGIHSAVIPHITIGAGVVVAAGAVVVRSVPSGRVMGVPARVK